jgi:hypothetical protein
MAAVDRDGRVAEAVVIDATLLQLQGTSGAPPPVRGRHQVASIPAEHPARAGTTCHQAEKKRLIHAPGHPEDRHVRRTRVPYRRNHRIAAVVWAAKHLWDLAPREVPQVAVR